MELIKTQAKEIFTKTKLPGADWVINQYVGCEHACLYCYAKFMSRWKKHGKWGCWVEAKINAPDLVEGRFIPGMVFMSSVSDAYQPIEKKLKLTRKILEKMDKRIKLSILTKSDLVLRDISLLKKFKDVEVGFTINSFRGKEKQIFEPDSPSNESRIKALKILNQDGIKTYAFISPIIPGLIGLEDIINKTQKYADYYWFEMINLSGAGSDFIEILKKDYPKSFALLVNKEKLNNYIDSLREIISRHQIISKGMEIH